MKFVLKTYIKKIEAYAKNHATLVTVGSIVFAGAFLVITATAIPVQIEQGILGEYRAQQVGESVGGDVIIHPPEKKASVPPSKVAIAKDPSTFDAYGIMVRDVESGSFLYSKAEHTKRPIASITKLMTALTLLDYGVPWSASFVVDTPPEVIGSQVSEGMEYSVEELWLAMLIGSSNKAAVTLASNVATSTEVFVQRMNELAQSYGMRDTYFAEPTGLDAENVSTPQDILVLLDTALKKTAIRDALRTTDITVKKSSDPDHHIWNTNWLLIGWIPHQFYQVIGGKTGYIDASLYNFTSRIVTVDGIVLDVVILGASTHEARFTEARDVVRSVLAAYDWKK